MRTINALDEVKAREYTLFFQSVPHSFVKNARVRAFASLSGIVPNKAQIQGITALVGGAVDSLEVSDVVLVDDKGRLLSTERDDDEMTMGLPALFEARQAYESRYRKTVVSALTPILAVKMR